MKKCNPILYDDINEYVYVFTSFEKNMKRLQHFFPVPVLISFNGKNLLTNQNFFGTSTLGKILMPFSANSFLISFMKTGFPSVNEELVTNT